MARRPVAAANWKMYKTRAQAKAFIEAFRAAMASADAALVVICPPFTAIESVREALAGTGIGLGAQDVHWEAEGAFTGEVAAGMVKEAGCSHVIIGHSERRRLFGESDETVNRKLKAALREGLAPILCVGETLPEREAGKTEQTIWTQLTDGLDGIEGGALRSFLVAYEPVWAIGTGRNATPEQAQEVHAFIRAFLAKRGGGVDAGPPVLYGGSVKPDNASALMRGPDVDGALVGGAGLDPASFAAIVKAVGEARRT